MRSNGTARRVLAAGCLAAAVSVVGAAGYASAASLVPGAVVRAGPEDFQTLTPRLVVVTQDNTQLKCRAGGPYYPVALLKSGTVLRVDGESAEWLRSEYPAIDGGISAYVKADDAQEQGGGKVKLTRPTRLMAANVAGGARGNWWYLLDKNLEPGAVFDVKQTLRDPSGSVYGYLIPAPTTARGYVKKDQTRAATPDEIKAWDTARAPKNDAAAAAERPVTVETVVASPAEADEPTDAVPIANGAEHAAPDEPKPLVREPAISGEPGRPEEAEPDASTPADGAPADHDPAGLESPEDSRPAVDLDGLSELFKRVLGQPLEEAELEAAVAEFDRSIAALGAPPADARLARALGARKQLLEVRIELRRTLSEETGAGEQLRQRAEEVARERAAAMKDTRYAMIGVLTASTVYDGTDLPKMYRLIAGTGTRTRTVGYISPALGTDLEKMIGRLVGVDGRVKYDGALKLRVLTPTRIDVLPLDGADAPVSPEGAPAPAAGG